MNLKHVLSTSCPTCGCSTVVAEGVQVSHGGDCRERKITTHINGGRWEYRTFLCGRTVKWVPNFSEESATDICTRSNDYEKTIEKIRGLDEEIRKLNEFRGKLYSSL
jgi:hypothetical protein